MFAWLINKQLFKLLIPLTSINPIAAQLALAPLALQSRASGVGQTGLIPDCELRDKATKSLANIKRSIKTF